MLTAAISPSPPAQLLLAVDGTRVFGVYTMSELVQDSLMNFGIPPSCFATEDGAYFLERVSMVRVCVCVCVCVRACVCVCVVVPFVLP
ncbi:MAG: hypothetical protein P4L40_03920 [Terracidiphilus sp.]|nr:hypothetical protein [Terracidiphilus sp.]